MQKDILFDNIYVGHSIEDAEKLQKEAYDVKLAIEKAEEEASKPKKDESAKSPFDLTFGDDPVRYVKERTALFFEILQKDPVAALTMVPDVAGGIGGIVALLIALIAVVATGGSKAAPSKEQVKAAADKAAAKAVEAKDKAAEAVSTGAEKASEATKRNTRSSS